jgi:hypothetical protein
MSFRFDVKEIKIPKQSHCNSSKEIVAFIVTKVQNFNNKKLVYLGLVKMLFRSLKGKYFAFYFKMRFN